MAISDFAWAAGAVGAVTAALIAGSVARRNAQKHPYERLKLLVEIAEKMPARADSEGVLKAAIGEELRALREMRSFDKLHPWLRRIQYGAAPVSFVLVALIAALTSERGPFPATSTWQVVGGIAVACVIGVGGGFIAGRISRMRQKARTSERVNQVAHGSDSSPQLDPSADEVG
ncbi:hypothetical protein GCM10007304_17960 [Rhodococcoides trifolii]|uniref:Uncharacterized protein n=1 Tax=Rhodococcoides trifolii TaxID=908250 RepID=A0A917D2F3_9NOCA|nr:hypothetical protein [Rhodococcus trifolii]GGG04249.1 hypothetical protein GCM10007304_17960 [Rhodococcus trifolii]